MNVKPYKQGCQQDFSTTWKLSDYKTVVLELAEPNLSRAMQWLNLSYSVWFNRRHGRSGHLFQGRFKSVTVKPEEWALALSRYVQAAQVGERLARLRQYRWSSYRAYIGLDKQPEWLQCDAVLDLGGGMKEVIQKLAESLIAVSDNSFRSTQPLPDNLQGDYRYFLSLCDGGYTKDHFFHFFGQCGPRQHNLHEWNQVGLWKKYYGLDDKTFVFAEDILGTQFCFDIRGNRRVVKMLVPGSAKSTLCAIPPLLPGVGARTSPGAFGRVASEQ